MEKGAYFGKRENDDIKKSLQSPLLCTVRLLEQGNLIYIQVHSVISPSPYLNFEMLPTVYIKNNHHVVK